MKTVIVNSFIILFLIAGSMACSSGNDSENGTGTNNTAVEDGIPEMTFEETEFDFGKLTEGEKVSHNFRFTNTGDGTLVINSAHASCGCTVADYPKEPIPPGSEGVVEVVFNSAGKLGIQNKAVSLTTNTEKGREELRFKAEVTSY